MCGIWILHDDKNWSCQTQTKNVNSIYELKNTVRIHIVHYCCYDAIVITQNIYFLKLKFAKI